MNNNNKEEPVNEEQVASEEQNSSTKLQLAVSLLNPTALFGGAAIGVANIVPGVSSGTIALVLGIYSRILSAMGNIRSAPYGLKGNIIFLAQLAIGLAAGIFGFAFLMELLLIHVPDQAQMWFVGLIAGSLPFLITQLDKPRLKPMHLLPFLLGLGVMLALFFAVEGPEQSSNAVAQRMQVRGLVDALIIFAVGAVAAAAMVIPGISGSFLLLAMGYYESVLAALRGFELAFLFIFGLGVLTGIFLISKLITLLLERFKNATFACIIGLVLGSIPEILPAFTSTNGLIGSIVALLFGVLMSLALGADKKQKANAELAAEAVALQADSETTKQSDKESGR